MKRLLGASAVTAMLVLLAPLARADGGEQKAAAQVLFDSGRELVLQQKFAEACPKFAQSLKLDQGLGTMLWLADCYENNGQSASAWAQFTEAAGVAAMQKDPREALARRRVAALQSKLSLLVVAFPRTSAPGVEIRRDGVVVAPTEIGLPVPVDPGIHAIAVSAAGYKPWVANVDVPAEASAPLVVNVPVLEPMPAPPLAATPAAGTVAMPAEPAREGPTAWPTLRIAGASIAALGLVGVGVGSVLGLSAKSSYDDSNKDGHCLSDNRCDATGKQRRSDASGLATGATIAFVAGSAALIGGAILFFAAPTDKKSGLRVVPVLGQRDAGVVVMRRF